MPKISAIIHANNDEHRLGRTLETLRACDEVVVVDHGSNDHTREVAREYGASVIPGVMGVHRGTYVADLKNDWVLCLRPSESLSESLEASLLEWKNNELDGDCPNGYCMAVRQETPSGWRTQPAELRLVNRSRINWTEELPSSVDCASSTLAGEILRFSEP